MSNEPKPPRRLQCTLCPRELFTYRGMASHISQVHKKWPPEEFMRVIPADPGDHTDETPNEDTP